MTNVPTRPDDGDGRGAAAFERVPPQDLDAEQSVLGGMLLSTDAIGDVLPLLKGHDFYRPAHETIYGAILDLYGRGEPADPITVAAHLTKLGTLDKVGGASYLHTLVQCVPTAANAEWYAEIVRDRAVLRRLATAGTRIVQLAHRGEDGAAAVADQAEAELYAATDARTEEDLIPSAALMESTTDALEAMMGHDGAINGVPTGFYDLDALTRGLQSDQLVLIAARPAVGKTTLATDVLRAASIKHGLSAVMFSLEMGRNEIGMRLLSAQARVALHHMRAGTMTDDDWSRMARAMPDMSEAPFHIDDSPNLTMLDIRSKCRRHSARHGLDLVIVDYIQLMETGNPGARRPENRQQEVSQISRNLKLLAKELGVPVLALSQLNRGPEQRTDKKPLLSDLRESGSLEQDADLVILLHREDAYEKDSPRAGEADLIVAKHRNGPTGTITVAFQGHYSRFVDMAQDGTVHEHPMTYTRERARPAVQRSQSLPEPRSGERAGEWPVGAQAPAQPVSQAYVGETAQVAGTSISDELAAAAASDVLSLEIPHPTSDQNELADTEQQGTAAAAHGEEPLAEAPASRRAAPRKRGAEARPDLLTTIRRHIIEALDAHDGDPAAAAKMLMGDGPNKAGKTIENIMGLWEASRVGTRYDPTAYLNDAPDPLVRKRKDAGVDVWEGRVRFTHPSPDLHGKIATPLDVNGAYLSALGTAHLPVRKITHNPEGVHEKYGPWTWENPDNYGRGVDLAGIVRITPPKWPHIELPDPLGDRETRGKLWIPTSLYLKLKDAASESYGHLIDAPPTIHEAYVAPGTDVLFKPLAAALNAARTQAFAEGDDLLRAYVAKCYAVLVSTMGDSTANKHLKRPDWERIVRGHAFANLWRKAVRARQAGLTVAYAGGTDELHVIGDPWTAERGGKPLFREGRGLAEIKTKGAPYTWTGKAVK